LVRVSGYRAVMSGVITRLVAPWKFRREQDQKRVAALRERDGDDCRRCRRPIRFDLPDGHDRGPKIEAVPAEEAGGLENLCLCHGRCNAAGTDHTDEVTERIRRRGEAELLSRKKPTKRQA
jgi:hypothetical protein